MCSEAEKKHYKIGFYHTIIDVKAGKNTLLVVIDFSGHHKPMPYNVLTVQELLDICAVLGVPASRFITDYSTDKTIEVSDLERKLVQVFREFSEEKQQKVLQIIKELKDF